jgi:hypothetical protein
MRKNVKNNEGIFEQLNFGPSKLLVVGDENIQ